MLHCTIASYYFADVIKSTVNVGVVVGDERLPPIRQGKYK